MSRKLEIPCNETLKEIGIFNRIQAIFIPVDVSVSISFLETPKDDELFPLTRLVSDKDANGDMVENARRCFLHITGTSAEDMILICSNVTAESGYVDVEELETIELQANTKVAIEKAHFIPNGTAIQQTIVAASSYTFTKTNETMIRFHCTDETGVELDGNTIKYPMFEEELRLDNLSEVKFHNDNTSDIVLTIWSM